MFDEILATGALHLPWPTASHSKVYDALVAEPLACTNDCEQRVCMQGHGTILGKKCPYGFTFYESKIDKFSIVVYGVLGRDGKEALSKYIQYKYKDDLKGRTCTTQQFSEWMEKLRALFNFLSKKEAKKISEALHPLHETPKLAQEIRNAAESLIIGKPGASFDLKFDAASPAERTIFKAADLLVDSFDMLAIFFNPASASLGDLHTIEPYKLVDKLTRLLAISKNGGFRKKIAMEGGSFRKFNVFESFKIIPLVLINNAVKYSIDDSITIRFVDKADHTFIEVVSVGPAIRDGEREIIFERGVRGVYGQAIDGDGMGVGLFVAQEAAKANRTRINVSCGPAKYERNGIPISENRFSFEVRDVRI